VHLIDAMTKMTSDSLEPAVVSQTIRNLAISNAVNLFLLVALLLAALLPIARSFGKGNAGIPSYSTSPASSDIPR
jgi:hypothetical protein